MVTCAKIYETNASQIRYDKSMSNTLTKSATECDPKSEHNVQHIILSGGTGPQAR